ncbi:kinesin-like protein KIF22 [Cucumis melo var. makuwa]|uniref:Kinesin-like protein n=1 Tax=Cucumis melo var. makuwa TaxID=1194695 RepID=A0A5A7TS94_CUCMM|nr:kinesin-like protein KIF22 [Cucumis melo var. makuwa]TYK25048.1 kinesin-like protein KIF22 [Cucumis melo var. makuwa]
MASEIFAPAASTNNSAISKVRVVARVRPFLPLEGSVKSSRVPVSCISVLDQARISQEEVTVHLKDPETSRNECYQLDSFYGQEDHTVRQIFDKEVNPLIPGLFHGCNGTVFAYGATGSGKTYTMQGTEEEPGLMPLAMSRILSLCKETGCRAEISYYEVYLERCHDLLEPKAKEILILDDKEGQIHLRGLSKVAINSMAEFRETLAIGIQRRKVADTDLNDVSSRSHGVLVIAVSSPVCGDSGASVTGKLNLIDLAGNEDNRRTGNEGIRLQESAKINQSLFALSNVIYALNKNLARIPYRESKLTRILQDSLGGTSRALMIACLNPGAYQESVHTVSLAARSRQISNFVLPVHKHGTPQAKVDMESKLQTWLESKGKTKSAQRIGGLGSPFSSKTPCSTASKLRKPLFNSSTKVKKTADQSAWKQEKERSVTMAFGNLVEKEDVVNSITTKDHVKVKFSSPRKALSPLHNNGIQKPTLEFSFTDQLLTASTPKTPLPANGEFRSFGTPLDKFGAQVSTLKSCVAQEYVDFLNTASREELLELKGIGVKMAEYILDLRETSPLKSLTDLKKLGLSYKQIHNLFSKAARGIFDRIEDLPERLRDGLP